MTAVSGLSLYSGLVTHARFMPRRHRFSYRVFQFLIDVQEIRNIGRASWLLSANRLNIFSIYEDDYFPHMRGMSLGQKLRHILAEQGIVVAPSDHMEMLTLPRVLGYGFNPITVFYVKSAAGTPVAILYEVRNTFGDRCHYAFALGAGDGIETQHSSPKTMHVSPFFDVSGVYSFRHRRSDTALSLVIDYHRDQNRLLTASFLGTHRVCTTARLAWFAVIMPFISIKISAAIGIEALKLRLKGLTVFGKPQGHVVHTTMAANVDPASLETDS